PREIMSEKLPDHWPMSPPDADSPPERWTYTRLMGLRRFTGTHPQATVPWIEGPKDHGIDTMQLPKCYSFRYVREWISAVIEKLTGGWRMGEWRNFREIRRS